MPGLDNANPTVFRTAQQSIRKENNRKDDLWEDDGIMDETSPEFEPDPIDEQEIFGIYCYNLLCSCWSFSHDLSDIDLIRSISDPEHPLSLEELAVVSAPQIIVSPNNVRVEFTPTVPHCGASTLIGKFLCQHNLS